MAALALIHPELQRRLVAVQAAGADPASVLPGALDLCGVPPSAPLRSLLLAHPRPAAVLAAAANASGHPCALGVLLAQLLASSALHSSQLLPALDGGEWAAAITRLHAAASSATLPKPACGAAASAFTTLLKTLVTCSLDAEPLQGERQLQQRAERALQRLRQAWAGCGSGDGPADPELLSAAVEVVDREVFPRLAAHSWVAGELGCLLLATDGDSAGESGEQQAATSAGLGSDGAWSAAMAAFAGALPTDTLLEQVQAAASTGTLHAARAAALLAAAAADPTAARSIDAWIRQAAAVALQQHVGGCLRGLLLLQRGLLLRREEPAPAPGAQHPSPAPPTAQQRYGSWFGGTLLAPHQHPHLQFLLQQLLIPMLPEDGASWLQAQASELGALLRPSPQQAAALPASSAQLLEDYLGAAQQRLRAEQQQQQGPAGGRGAGAGAAGAVGGSAVPLSNLEKGREIVNGLLKEFGQHDGQLRGATLDAMLAKAANVFTRGELHTMLAPAALEPCAEAAAAAQRAALMLYLHEELGRRGDTLVRHHFRPEAVRQYQQRCLQAQLDGATLQQLADRAGGLLLGGSAAAVGGHQLLDRLGRLAGEQLHAWQQVQRVCPGSGAERAAAAGSAAPSSPAELAELLVATWTAAYSGGGGSANAEGGAPELALAAHLLGIVHGLPPLHAPLLRRLRAALLQPAGQQGGGHELEAAVLLATVAGALVQPPCQQPSGAAAAAASLQPLFVWRRGPGRDCGCARGRECPAEVAGPAWLQQALERLPLGSAADVAGASRAAAGHVACLRHFQSYSLLPDSLSGSQCGGAAPLRWSRPAAAAPSLAAGRWDGEWAARLTFPACPAALRLQQWLALRLLVAEQLLGADWGGGWEAGRAAKRARGASDEGREPPALQDCAACMESQPFATLAAAAGKLRLLDFLRLEARAAADGGRGALLPPGAADAVFRLCCGRYVGGSAGEGLPQALSALVEPLAAGAGGGNGSQPGTQHFGAADELEVIPDSEEEDAAILTGAAAAGAIQPPVAGSSSVTATVDGMAGAVAAVLRAAAGAERLANVAVTVCQQACAQALRLLGPQQLQPRLLAALLCSLARQCREQLPAGVAPAGPPHTAALRLVYAGEAPTHDLVAALAAGLLLELLPSPLAGARPLQRQQRRLAALAGAVRAGLAGEAGDEAVLRASLLAAVAV